MMKKFLWLYFFARQGAYLRPAIPTIAPLVSVCWQLFYQQGFFDIYFSKYK
jgi:hypothetical protein